MKLNDYPEPEIQPLGPDDAADDPARSVPHLPRFRRDAIHPSRRDRRQDVAYYKEHGVQGGYTHLRAGQLS